MHSSVRRFGCLRSLPSHARHPSSHVIADARQRQARTVAVLSLKETPVGYGMLCEVPELPLVGGAELD